MEVERQMGIERAFLVRACWVDEQWDEAESLLMELCELVRTLDIPIIASRLIAYREPQAKYLVGGGKAQEVSEEAKNAGASLLVFDNELTPAQQRNWSKLCGLPVIDRRDVILEIFAQRARTREARLQVELARLEHALPRLVRAWSHLGQQAGGIGGRGEGETQLEQDKRRIRAQIDRLRREIAEVRANRATQRKDRNRVPVPNAALVGYTNAGKSSLLRALTGADVLVEDKLFATLDPTTRRLALPNNQPLLLTDTVGFVRNLPHGLVDAFNATLEEAALADFLIHVLDASQAEFSKYYETTIRVLAELGAEGKPVLVVFNKMDLVDMERRVILRRVFPDAVYVSAVTGDGLGDLVERISEFVAVGLETFELAVPQSRSDVVARLHREGDVRAINYSGDEVELRVRLPRRARSWVMPYLLRGRAGGDLGDGVFSGPAKVALAGKGISDDVEDSLTRKDFSGDVIEVSVGANDGDVELV